MQVFFEDKNLPVIKNPVVTLGNFDGVHKGHQSIISALKNKAAKISGKSVLITFSPHPRKLLRPDVENFHILTTTNEKISLLQKTGLDYLYIITFNKAFASLDYHEFFRIHIIEKIRAHTIVVGHDHRFGKDRKGNYEELSKQAEPFGINVIKTNPLLLNGAVISSKKIRNFIQHGQVEKAHFFLGYPYFMSGTVVHGDHIGKKLGFPTANIALSDQSKLLPGNGVYAAKINFEQKTYDAVINIGVRPTIKTNGIISTEAHLLNFSKVIYGKKLKVFFYAKIRDEKKYSDTDWLRKQIEKDIEIAKNLLNRQA